MRINILFAVSCLLTQGYLKKGETDVLRPSLHHRCTGRQTAAGNSVECIAVRESRLDRPMNKQFFFNDGDLCRWGQ